MLLIFDKGKIYQYLSWESRNLHSHDQESQIKVKSSDFSFTSKKDFQERTYKTGKKGQNKSEKIKNTHLNEQQWESVTCSVTINSNMYDSDFSITTSPLIYQLPTVGIDQCKH